LRKQVVLARHSLHGVRPRRGRPAPFACRTSGVGWCKTLRRARDAVVWRASDPSVGVETAIESRPTGLAFAFSGKSLGKRMGFTAHQALVNGGTGAIGRAVVHRLAREGHSVIAIYRSEDAACEETARELPLEISVNAVCAGAAQREKITQASGQQLEALVRRMPLHRAATADEVSQEWSTCFATTERPTSPHLHRRWSELVP
jgi:hypothetical protein